MRPPSLKQARYIESAITLPRLKDSKVISMVDEDAPEKAGREQAIELRHVGGVCISSAGDEKHIGQIEGSNSHLL